MDDIELGSDELMRQDVGGVAFGRLFEQRDGLFFGIGHPADGDLLHRPVIGVVLPIAMRIGAVGVLPGAGEYLSRHT